MCRNGFLVFDSWRGVAYEAIRVLVVGRWCGQEEPGIIMQVKLATGSTVVEKTGNAHMKARSKHSLLTETASNLITYDIFYILITY